MATANPTLKFTVDQYDRMIDAGVFAQPPAGEDAGVDARRVELIDGEIAMMSPIGSRHEEIVDRLNEWSLDVVDRQSVRIRVQQSLSIPGRPSVPQPDIAWVRRKDYAVKRPSAADALLVIEVAETSLAFDLGPKAIGYAAGGLLEYWVVDVAGETLHVFRDPEAAGLQTHVHVGRGEHMTPLAQPSTSLPVDLLFARRP